MTAQQEPVSSRFRKVRIILNPVSGFDNHSEETIRTLMTAYTDLKWDIHRTQGDGDAFRATQEACAAGYDLVIASGGDGTVREVADGLLDYTVPLSILPNGTANVLSVELGFPRDAGMILAALFSGNYDLRQIDAAKMDQKTLLLRAGIGYEAEISVGATREAKSRYGRLAYFVTAWHKLRRLRPTRYHLTLDGVEVVRRGVTCLICNSTNIGIPNVKLVAATDVSDGKIDIILVPNLRLPQILTGAWQTLQSIFPFGKSQTPTVLNHWQVREVTVQTKRPQMMAIDGEPYKRGKRTTVVVLPGALTVAVPR